MNHFLYCKSLVLLVTFQSGTHTSGPEPTPRVQHLHVRSRTHTSGPEPSHLGLEPSHRVRKSPAHTKNFSGKLCRTTILLGIENVARQSPLSHDKVSSQQTIHFLTHHSVRAITSAVCRATILQEFGLSHDNLSKHYK